MAGGEWGDLAGADCHAVVVGTGRQGDGAGLADLPGAARSARELARLLRERAGMAGRVTEIIDPESPTEVLAAVRTAVHRAEGGAVLFCFVGHGLLGPRRQLYLATTRTATADDTVNAVPYAEIRNLLADASARTVVVLDCCFSGRAEAAPSGAHRDPYVSARPAGSFLLASATHYAASFAPVGQEHTLFSGELIRLLAEGDPSGPKWLTLIDLYRILDRRFQGGPARPYADGVGRAGDLVVTRNAGYLAVAPSSPGGEGGSAAPEAQAPGPCPYPGMRPFLPEQSHLFFGREELSEALRRQVEHGQGPVVLVGASGAGKSSLLRAGLVAGLEERRAGSVLLVPGPGARPFHRLVERWAQAVRRPFAEVERELGAGRFVGAGGPAVLVVDQLEELFTDCDDAEERELFVRALAGADPATAPRIVLGLRADFYGPCLRDPRLARIVRAGQFTVPAMSDDELLAAIERPAEHAGLRLEDGLASHLLHELRLETAGDGEAVALPFLAHALQQTWARRRGALLTFSGYESAGGIRSSVARVADEVHDALDADGRARLRALLLRMVTLVDAGGRAVRRRVPVPEAEGDADRELLDRLADARLVVLDRGEAQLCHDSLLYGWPLLRDWIRADRVRLLVLRRVGDAADTWHEAGRPPAMLYRGDQLATARSLLTDPPPKTRPWWKPRATPGQPLPGGPDGRGRGDSGVPSGPGDGGPKAGGPSADRPNPVAPGADGPEAVAPDAVAPGTEDPGSAGRAAGRVAGQDGGPLGPLRPVERDFLVAGERAERLGRRVRRAIVAGVAGLAVLAGSLAVVARGAQRDAEARETVAVANQLAAQADTMRERDPQTALRLSLAAYRTAETSETRSSLYASYLSRPQVELRGDVRQPVLNLAYGPDGKVLAVGRRTGRIRLWDLTVPNAPARGAELRLDGTAPIAFHPSRPLLAALGKAALRLYDVTDPAHPKQVGEQRLAATQSFSVAFSPDGRTLAAGSEAGRLRLWDVAVPSRPRPLLDRTVARAELISVAFPHDGRFLATGNGNSQDASGRNRPAEVRLWDVRDPARATLLTTVTSASVMAVAFHPKRDLLVATGGEGAMAWWTVARDGRRLDRIKPEDGFQGTWGYGSSLPSLSFRPDGKMLAAAQAGDPGGAAVRAVARTDDAALLSSSAENGTLPSGEPAQSVAYSRDGAYLALGDTGGNVRLWPELAPALAVPGRLASGDPGTRPYSADGRFVLTDESDAGSLLGGEVRVWDMSTADTLKGVPPRRSFTLPRPWEARYFLPGRDRPMLLAHRWTEGTDDHAFRVWDLGGDGPPVAGGEMPVRAGDVRTAMSPDGALLVIGSSREPSAAVWDIRDPRRPVRRAVIAVTPSYEPESMFFMGPRGLATVEGDGRSRGLNLRLWDLEDPTRPFRVPAPLKDAARDHAMYVRSLRLLVADRTDQSAQMWDMTDIRHPKPVGRLPAAPGGYHPVGDLLATTLQDGTVRLVDVKDPKHPKVRHTLRFDREITDVQVAPDGTRVLTGSPYRIWDVEPDGSWRMPAVATLDGVRSVALLPGRTPYVIVLPDRTNLDETEATYLLDRDTRKVYERLCATHPLGVEPDQWKALFPHLDYRESC
ncbi:caspase family protein [Streptomyces sp. NPDC053493]|uniref:caspase, EACC1-associated type n=1 Tax=Streptomyces sp. NPDC053493 TaxID=3365705 RepID=UPI0037CFD62D